MISVAPKELTMPDTSKWSGVQVALARMVVEAESNDDQVRALLKWALARVTFYGPMDEPVAEMIRRWMDTP